MTTPITLTKINSTYDTLELRFKRTLRELRKLSARGEMDLLWWDFDHAPTPERQDDVLAVYEAFAGLTWDADQQKYIS